MMKNKLPMLLNSSLLLFVTLCLPVSSTQFHFARKYCVDSAGNYTANSTYEDNLNLMFDYIPKDSSPELFEANVAGDWDEAVMQYNCRGDLSVQDCRDCAVQAAKAIVAECPYRKEAIVWYEECMLRIANRSILNTEEESPLGWITSDTNVSNPLLFDQVLVHTIDGLIKDAAYDNSTNGYAIGQADLPPSVVSAASNSDKVYCMVQCTPDIGGTRCERCLRAALSSMAGCCGIARPSLQMYLPSCQLRYSTVAFIPGTGPPPPSPANSSLSPPPIKGGAATMIKLSGELPILGLILAVNMFFTIPTPN